MPLSDFFGIPRRCDGCKNGNQFCGLCLCRGFVAPCLACSGTGSIKAPVYGSGGDMKSTCDKCGGKGIFPVNEPEGWTDKPEEILDENDQQISKEQSGGDGSNQNDVEEDDDDDQDEDDDDDDDDDDSTQGSMPDAPLIRPKGFQKKKWNAMTPEQRQEVINAQAATV